MPDLTALIIRQRFRYAFLYLVLLSVVVSCYDPSGEHLVDVKPPSIEGMSISLENYKDTVRLSQNKILTFIYKGKLVLKSFELSIDGVIQQQPSSSQNVFRFLLDVQKTGNGIHAMQIKAITKSNSESLANKLEVELVIVTKNFVLLIE